MKTLTLIISLLLLAIINLNAQTLEWALMGPVYAMNPKPIVDSNGNIYTVGDYYGPCDFDPGPNIFNLVDSSGDIFIRKLDKNGNFCWAKRIGGPNQDFYTSSVGDEDGNLYVTGCFFGTIDIDPGPGIENLTSIGGHFNVFICKFDNSGSFIWVKQLVCNTGINSSWTNDITIDANRNVFLTGLFYGTVDFDPSLSEYNLTADGNQDVFVEKLDSNGNFIWAKKWGSVDYDSGQKIKVDNSGNVYIVGSFEGCVDMDPGVGSFYLTAPGTESSLFIEKLDSNGIFSWAFICPQNVLSLAVDSNSNLYTTGSFFGTVDFDPGIGIFNLTSYGSEDIYIRKLDSSGNFIWAKSMGGIYEDYGSYITIDHEGNLYCTGYFSGNVDFDPNSGTFNMASESGGDIFINKFTTNGNHCWTKRIGGSLNEISETIEVDRNNNIYVTGYINAATDFDPNAGTYYLTPVDSFGRFILKIKQKGITGFVYNDINQNCTVDSNEIGLQNRFVTINPGNIITQTNESGIWVVDSLPVGYYSATVNTSGNWSATCPVTQNFVVSNPNEITIVPDFGFVSTQPCVSPEVSINMPFMRPCFNNQLVYVNVCNQNIATGVLNNAYVDILLDSLIIPQSASIAYTSLGNNIFRFQLGNLYPGQCVNFTINCNESCNVIIGQTLCVKANLYPVDSCVLDTIPSPYPGNFTPCTTPWDKSSIEVEGYCQNDSIYFVITNTGWNMNCFSPVRVYIDGVYTILDSIQLTAGDTAIFAFAGDGRTWRLETDQHPLHPGNSQPNATVEACGDTSNWTPSMVNILPPDDADPFVDIYCGVVSASYDPNDKTGYPTGVTIKHYIMPNQQLQYVIRFQNTGTDTAFTVVVRDTLDMNLDIFSVLPGVASHTYNFQMYGPRVLEWTFYNILLPDSNHNQEESQGFATFTVNQNHDLANGTQIFNEADIYFDYNAPIITNQTIHTINNMIQTILIVSPINNSASKIMVYPNPVSEEINIELLVSNSSEIKNSRYTLYSIEGKKVMEGKLQSSKSGISISNLENGLYFIEICYGKEKYNSKLIITK